MSDPEQPKIIVDDDWKSAAQAEKERLASEEASKKQEPKGASPGGSLPEKASFDDLLRLMATQALMYMGAFPDPQTGQAMVALDLAKLHVDLLSVLEEKTRGNLSDEESKALTGILTELRMQFVEVTKAVAKAAEEGRLSQGTPGTPGAPPPTA
ncbi:MAG: DUF1844 domain-containing protein [Phycisphaerales bacterium JB059]